MAVTDQQKLDFLLKKIGYTKTKTGSVVGTGAISGTPKQPFAEAIPSPLIIANGALWNEADSIPATPPGADTNQVKVYLAATSGLRMTADATSSGQRAYIAYSTYNNTSSTRLTNWIDTQFGASYIIKVYRGDPNSGGVNLSAAGSGNNDGWFFDYSAGVLNFNDTNVPSGVNDTNIYIVGYRYIGQTGAPTSGISTFSFKDLTVERNLDVGIQGGISTFRNNIDVNADLDVDGHTNLDNVSVAGVSTFSDTVHVGTGVTILSNGRAEFTGFTTFTQGLEVPFYKPINIGSSLYGKIHYPSGGSSLVMQALNQLTFKCWTGNYFATGLYLNGISGLTRLGGYNMGNNSSIAPQLDVTGHTTQSITMKSSDGSNLTERFKLSQSGFNFTGLSTHLGNFDLDGDIDVDGHTNLDNVSVSGVTTITQSDQSLLALNVSGNTKFQGAGNSGDVLFTGASGKDLNWDKSAGSLDFTDGTKARFGDNYNLQISSSNTLTRFRIENSVPLTISKSTSEDIAKFIPDGAVELYHNNIKRLETTNSGVSITGNNVVSGNVTAVDGTFSGNVSIGGTLTYEDVTNVDSVGILTARSGIRVTGGVIEAQAGENKIPSLYANMAALPSAGTYHGMFAHVHSTGRGYFAHAGNWMELVNKEINGVVGTGTESYNIGILTATGADINGDLDVDGHTNLDNVSVSGIITANDFNYWDWQDYRSNIRIGNDAGNANLVSNGATGNILLGDRAGTSITSSSNNVMLGASAGRGVTTGSGVYIGASAGRYNQTGGSNVYIGAQSGSGSNHSGGQNVFVGTFTGIDRIGSNNTLVGYYAGRGTGGQTNNGDRLSFFGNQAGQKNISGDNNSGFGYFTLHNNESGDKNSGFGYDTLRNSTGDYNTAFGADAGKNLSSGDNNIFLGYNAQPSAVGVSNEATIGDANINHLRVPGIGVTFATSGNHITGVTTFSNTIRLPNFTGSDNTIGKIQIGDTNGYEIFHYNNYNYLTFTRPLLIRGDNIGRQIYIQPKIAEEGIIVNPDSSVDSYFDNNLRFKTANYGANVFGQNAAVSFQLYTAGGTKRGGLYATNANVISLLDAQDHQILRGVKDGAAELYHDNVKRLETTSVGVSIPQDLDVDGHTNLDNVSVGGATTITATNREIPFKVVAARGGGGIGTYLFTNSVGRFDFNFENTYNGNWNTGSTFHTRILWTAPNDGSTTPEVCSIFPNTASAGAGGALHSLEFSVTDNTSGLKKAYQMKHNQHQFYLNGNQVGLDINSTLGVGVTSYIYHGYTGGASDTNTRFGFASNHNIIFDTDGTERLRINNSSSTFAHNIIANGNIDLAGDIDVDGQTNLDHVSVAGVSTFSEDVKFVGATSGRDVQWDKSANYLRFNDNAFATFGNSDDLFIYHDGNHSQIRDVGTGHLILGGTHLYLTNGSGSEYFLQCIANNQVDLYFNNSIKLSTTSTGINVTGLTETDTFLSSGNATFSGTITAGGATGTNGQYLKSTGSGVAWDTFPTARTSQAFTASAGQTTFSFNYTVGLVDVFVNGIKLSTSEFTAANGTSVVLSVGCFVGDIVEILSYNTATGSSPSGIGNVVEDTTPQLGGIHDLFGKTITGTGGVNITGVVTATTFIVDGSGLTGIVASGSGVVIKNSGSTVGTAGTINFADNLSVTPISAGIVTITGAAGITTAEVRANTLAVSGISTFSDNIKIPADDKKLIVGADNDLELFHSGGNSIIKNTTSGSLLIHGNTIDLRPTTESGEVMLRATRNGSVELRHDNVKKFETRAGGATVSGTINATGGSFTGNLRFSNNVGTLFGASDELQVFHSSGTSYISHNGSGQLQLRAKHTEHGIKIFPDGAVELYHDNVKRLETSSVGVSIPQDLDVDGHTNLDNVSIAGVVTATTFKGAIEATSASFSSNIDANGDLDVDGHTNLDNVSVAGVSTFSDQLHITNNTPILRFNESDNNTASRILMSAGQLYIQAGAFGGGASTGNGNILLTGYNGQETYAIFNGNGAVQLYHNNIKKFDTTTSGINVTGTTDTDNLYVSGAATIKASALDTDFFSVIRQDSSSTKLLRIFQDSSSGGGAGGCHINTVNRNLMITANVAAGADDGLYLTTAGSIGINSTSPDRRFTLHQDATCRMNLKSLANSTAGIEFGDPDDHNIGFIVYDNTDNSMKFGVNAADRLRILSNGNVNVLKDLDVDGHTNLDNVSVAGVVTATSFVGDGSGLTNLPGGGSYGNNDVNNHLNVSGASSGQILSWNGSDYAWVADQTGSGTDVGITTNLSGSFTASAGSPSTINTFGYGSGDIVVEYTVFIKNGSNFQSQKLLAMRDGTTIHSTQFAVMYSSSLLVQLDATISSGNILLRATPETGVSGSTTYKVKREVM